MIQEQFVSFEVAKLLKKKGFKTKTEHEIWYVAKEFGTGTQWNYSSYKVGETTREWKKGYVIDMPTQQMIMRWLRETHNIHFLLDPFLTSEGKVAYCVNVLKGDLVESQFEDLEENTYEEACEKAIKYSLANLI